MNRCHAYRDARMRGASTSSRRISYSCVPDYTSLPPLLSPRVTFSCLHVALSHTGWIAPGRGEAGKAPDFTGTRKRWRCRHWPVLMLPSLHSEHSQFSRHPLCHHASQPCPVPSPRSCAAGPAWDSTLRGPDPRTGDCRCIYIR